MSTEDTQGIKLFGKTITYHGNVTQTQRREEYRQEPTTPQPQTAAKSDLTAEKRPEKIIPCPRCKSMETKFCYFNNYNVNQPRHFCKGCQRYWTAGGALRNVPVGAARRKTKPPGRGGVAMVGAAGFPEMLGASGVQQVEFEGLLVEEWQAATVHGGFRHDLPVKRPRCYTDGQSC